MFVDAECHSTSAICLIPEDFLKVSRFSNRAHSVRRTFARHAGWWSWLTGLMAELRSDEHVLVEIKAVHSSVLYYNLAQPLFVTRTFSGIYRVCLNPPP